MSRASTLLIAGLGLFAARLASGQGSTDTAGAAAAVHSTCRDPHPGPTCGSYFLAEMTATARLAGTSTPTPDCTLGSPFCGHEDLPGYLAWDIGWMVNRSSTWSVGGSLQIGGSEDGVRIALLGRQRSWVGSRAFVDMAAGVLTAQRAGSSNEGVRQTWGATGSVGVGYARIGGLVAGVDVARQSARVASSLHGGARLESRGFLVGTLVTVVGAIAVASALSDGWD